MYNDKEEIKKWAIHATTNVKDTTTRTQMRNLAYELADRGEWRGNISEAWAKAFDTKTLIKTRELNNLYL